MSDIKIFIPSYHRPHNIKSVKYLSNMGYDMSCVYVFIDTEADDKSEYDAECKKYGCNLVVVDKTESSERYDYVHRPSPIRRSAGQFRNMMHDYAIDNEIDFYCVMDDDTRRYDVRTMTKYRKAYLGDLRFVFGSIEKFMRARHIGVFGLPQTGDLIGGVRPNCLFLKKVMNTTFYLHPYIYRGEKGIQDDDTSQFVGIYNAGLFTGTLYSTIVLFQMPSAKQEGGLTDLYREQKLMNKALVTPIQYPSAIFAEKQVLNGNRLHHRINYRYLMPRILKNEGGRGNVAWDTYPEDVPFTSEPLNRRREG